MRTVKGVVRTARGAIEFAEFNPALALSSTALKRSVVRPWVVGEPCSIVIATSPPASYLAAARASAIAAACIVLASGILLTRSSWNAQREISNQVSRQASSVMVAAAADAPLDRLVQSAESGDANSELAIALRYLNGSVSARDPISGLHWMTRAAKHGSPVAEFMLGYLYEKGGTVAADASLAMRWYEAAALQGNRKAMHNLAVAYAQGLGGKKNLTEALSWFLRAASLGYVDSQFNLAVLYERGDGVQQSLVDAYKWYAIAGAQGDAESMAKTDALRTQLPAQDVAAAQRAARVFRALPFDPQANLAPTLQD